MKSVLYQPQHFDKPAKGILLEDIQDVNAYQIYKERKIDEDLFYYVTKGKTTPALVAALTLNDANVIDRFAVAAHNCKIKILDMGYMVCINSSGGYIPVKEEDIVEILGSINLRNKNLTLNNSNVIVLENDPIMDEFTVEYFNKLNQPFSSIVNLREEMKRDSLKNSLEQFKNNCLNETQIVFVYTTGIDEQQMYDYAQMCLDNGLTNFEYFFSVDTDTNDKFINWLNTKATVTVIEKGK